MAVRTAPELRRFKLENALAAIGKHEVLEILDKIMVMARILILSLPGLGLVGDLCHSYPGYSITKDLKEQKWLKISPNKSVT